MRSDQLTLCTALALFVVGPLGATPRIDLALCLDSSGSISNGDFELQLEGTAAAVLNPTILPRDGSVRLTVLQFGTYVSVEVPPTTIDSEGDAQSVANAILTMPKGGGSTNMDGCLTTATSQILGAVPSSSTQIIDLSTDGMPNSSSATISAAQAAASSGVDVLNAIGVGSADIPFLESIVFPGPAGGAEGFVADVDGYEAYRDVIGFKINLEAASSLPILFVHGFCSDGSTWDGMLDDLRDAGNVVDVSRYEGATATDCEGSDCYHLYWDRQQVRRRSGNGTVLPSAVYVMTMRANGASDPYDKLLVNDVPIENMAYQLHQVIEKIKAVNAVSQVYLVGHSMGGLVSRTYVQGRGVDDDGQPLLYDGTTVRRIVTVDTPHSGAPGANWSLWSPGWWDLECPVESSVNKTQMQADGAFLTGLNGLDFPDQVVLEAVGSTVGIPFVSWYDEADDVVWGASQDITTIPSFDQCSGSQNVGNVRGRHLSFIRTPLDYLLHNTILKKGTVAREIDRALFVYGLLFGDELYLTCFTLDPTIPFDLGEVEVGTSGATTVALDFGETPSRASCPVEIRAFQQGGLAGSQEVEGEGLQLATIGGLAPGEASFEIESPCAVEVRSASAFDGSPVESDTRCSGDSTTLCIDDAPGDGRFRVSAVFDTELGGGVAGAARATPIADLGVTDGGVLSFFDPSNPELLVKVLDGCPVNGHRWVFFAATTSAGFTLTVEDTKTGEFKQYSNDDFHAATTVTDTEALASCDRSAEPERAPLAPFAAPISPDPRAWEPPSRDGSVPVRAVNLVANPDLDADVGGWQLNTGLGSGSISWNGEDASGAAGSGSLFLRANCAGCAPNAFQCIEVQGGELYRAGASVRVPTGQVAGVAQFGVIPYSGPGCTGGWVYPQILSPEYGPSSLWSRFEVERTMPPAARSAWVAVASVHPGGSGTFAALFDEFEFGRVEPSVTVSGPTFGGIGQNLSFQATAADCVGGGWSWSASGGGTISGSGASISIRWNTPGTKTVTATSSVCEGASGSLQVGIAESVGTCQPSPTTLCIDDVPGDRRFAIRGHVDTVLGGGVSANAGVLPLASLGIEDGGILHFFGQSNPEVLVKVLNGCGVNGAYWVFYAATTSAGFTLTVEDTVAGTSTVYTNPDLHAADTVTDTSALLTCD